MKKRSYVLVTPVRDEAGTIARTIGAVTRQTLPPSEWIVVSDGSTDGTNELVEAAARTHGWIRLMALPPRTGRSFAAVVQNTEAGVSALQVRDYEYIGLLDADLDFQADYFETLIKRFEASPHLGLAGGVVIDLGRPKDRFPRNRIDVPGAVQLFRRDCFDRLGGLVAIPEGGWDSLTCAMARMSGFETKLFTDLVVDHLKPRNISQGGPLRRLWQLGVRDYAVGYHPVFELFKCLGRVTEPPFLAAAVARWSGFCAATLQRRPRVVPADVVAFVQKEQRHRLRGLWETVDGTRQPTNDRSHLESPRRVG
jgi:glycosyltransferase involved in cell wall biosynthesis